MKSRSLPHNLAFDLTLCFLILLQCVAKSAQAEHDPARSRHEALAYQTIKLEPDEGAYVFLRSERGLMLVSKISPQAKAQSINLDLSMALASAGGATSSTVEIARYSGWIVTVSPALAASTFRSSSEMSAILGKKLIDSRKAERLEVKQLLVGRGIRVAREFNHVFSGFAVKSGDESALEDAVARGEIRSFSPNFRVTTSVTPSVAGVGATSAWEQGFRGEGIRIGIIDTGIMIGHRDFGGCTVSQYLAGTCPKISRGYDFVDNDNDPSDCNGHGTHVASIAAGSGPQPGVAPSATIVPIRVLDCGGSGTESEVIAGIEWSMDPNSDGDTSDHLDVINVSLGGQGDPDSPMSRAIDAAAGVGIIPIVSAGNSGLAGIGAPGVAREAVTVGAVDHELRPAYFSSVGPVAWKAAGDNLQRFLFKPDLAAPGVDICAARLPGIADGSACENSKEVSLSGTSMSAPHVAGAAAIIRQAFPNWTVQEIKSALKRSTDVSNFSPLVVGNGLLITSKALTINEPCVAQF